LRYRYKLGFPGVLGYREMGTGMKTGIVRDDRYLVHKPGYNHPEHPRRLKAVYDALDRYHNDNLITVVPEPVTLETLELVHTPFYIDKVLKTAEHDFTSLAIDTPASSMTYLASWLAVGGCIKAIDDFFAGRYDVCVALVRPPGHHAMKNSAGGFCIFNNLGVAARYASKQYSLKRVMIVDWDVHHGNGINDLFYEDSDVFYLSTHDILLYPYTGNFEDVGTGEGEGYTVNIPIYRDMKDEDFVYIYQRVLTPAVLSYRPQLILVAAGFDAHHDDPIGRCNLTEQAFSWLADFLLGLRKEIKKPPVLFALEGGYQPGALASSVMALIRGLTEDTPCLDTPEPKTEQPLKIVDRVMEIHRKFGFLVE